MEIRVLHSADAADFQALRQRGLHECPTAFAASAEEEIALALDVVGHRLDTQDLGVVLGAFDNTGLIGIVGIRREYWRKLAHKSLLWGMYVAPEARKGGVGRALVSRALDYAGDKLGARQVALGVHTENVAAIALYRRLGFEQFGLERDYICIDGKFQDELHMMCVLPGA